MEICLRCLPVVEPYLVTQGFGENPEYYAKYGYAGHNGIDLVPDGRPAVGEPVRAVEAGIVVVSKLDANGYGEVVRVEHDGWYSLYAHLNKRMVRVNQAVDVGQVIGEMGWSGAVWDNTGQRSPQAAHLHFEVRRADGKSAPGYLYGVVDPGPYIKAVKCVPGGDDQRVVVAESLNVRLAPGGADRGDLVKGDKVRPVIGMEGVELNGVRWLPVVMWVAERAGGEKYLE